MRRLSLRTSASHSIGSGKSSSAICGTLVASGSQSEVASAILDFSNTPGTAARRRLMHVRFSTLLIQEAEHAAGRSTRKSCLTIPSSESMNSHGALESAPNLNKLLKSLKIPSSWAKEKLKSAQHTGPHRDFKSWISQHCITGHWWLRMSRALRPL